MIGVLQRVDVNLVSAILLVCVYRFAVKRLDTKDKINRLFLDISLVIIFQICMETLACFLNRRPEKWLIPAALVSNDLLFIMSPFLAYLYYIFARSWISPAKPYKKYTPLLLPLIFNTLLCFANLFIPLVFKISDSNIYVRLQLYFIPAAVTYFYMLVTFGYILKNRKDVMRSELVPLLLFGIFPGIAGAIQSLFYGILLMWSATACSFVMVFVFVQQRMMQLDPLTGAWAKGSFEHYLEEISEKKDTFGIVFIDLDNFKQINDTYGHLEGDSALKSTVGIIKDAVRKTDIVARFGGDEFAVILHNNSQEELEKIVQRIDSSFNQYNSGNNKKYSIKYSAGYGLYDPQKYEIWEFVNGVDHMMYENKNRKHSAARDKMVQ